MLRIFVTGFRLERLAGRALHPLESAALSRRTRQADIAERDNASLVGLSCVERRREMVPFVRRREECFGKSRELIDPVADESRLS
jgi:hypothetical protein